MQTLCEYAWDAALTITVLGACFAIMLGILFLGDGE